MRRRWIPRTLLLAGLGTAGAMLVSGVALASATAALHDSHRGVLAAQVADRSCAQIPGEAPVPGRDGWVFVLPKNNSAFASLTLRFRTTTGGTVTIQIPNGADAYPDGITTNGTSKAWLLTPAGWTLLDGTATLSKQTNAKFFNLTHACPARTTPSPSTSASPSTSTSTSPQPSGSTSPQPSGSVTGSGSPEGTPSESGGAPTTSAPGGNGGGGGTGGGLPTTGAAIGGLLLSGVAAIATGAALLWLRRRREDVTFASE